MRIWILIIGLASFVQLSCSEEAFMSFHEPSSITTLNGTWKVISFENYIDNSQEFKNQENSLGYDIIVKFDDTKNPNELSGTNTTNAFSGDFEYTGTGKMKFNYYLTTKVVQPAWADKFDQVIIGGEVSFLIDATALRIYYDNKTKSVTLTRE